MSKKESYKAFIDGKGYDVVEHQVMQPCFMIRTTKDEVWFFPWDAISSVRMDKKMMEIIKRNQEEAAEESRAAQAAPKIAVPRGPILPFNPDEPRN